MLTDSFHRSPLDREPEPRGKSHRPQHAQLVLRKPDRWFTDCPYQLRVEIAAAANEIQNAVFHPIACVEGNRIEQQSIDGEVPAQYVLARVERELHCIRSAPIAVGAVMPEGRNLGRNVFLGKMIDHQYNTEMRTHGLSARKRRLHQVGRSRSCHVEILWRHAQQQIPHTSAREIGSMPKRAQPPHNPQRSPVVRLVRSIHRCFDAIC